MKKYPITNFDNITYFCGASVDEKELNNFMIKNGWDSGNFIHAKSITDIKGKSKSKHNIISKVCAGIFSIYIAYNISNAHTRLFLTFIIYNFYVTYGRPSSNALISPIF